MFSEKEAKWAGVIRDIINSKEYDLNNKQEKLIKEFAVFQYCRTLAMYNYQKDTMNEVLEEIVSHQSPNVKKEVVKSFVKEKVQNELNISDIISICDRLVESIYDLNISIIRFDTSSKLIS